MPDAVLFDLDGVLLDSEQVWDAVRRDVVRDHGGTWTDAATAAMQGMSSVEWSRYLVDELHVPLNPEAVSQQVVDGVLRRYDAGPPLLPCAHGCVSALADRWPLALASSSNREVIDHVLPVAGLADRFRVTVSSEEVPHGKPAPDVYVEAARRLGVDPHDCVAVEDATNGIAAAHAAGARVVAVPNGHFPPSADALALASLVLTSLCDLTPDRVDALEAN